MYITQKEQHSEEIKCDVPKSSTQGPLLFWYLPVFRHVTKFLDLIMFADDTNLRYSNSNINGLFENVNKELVNVTVGVLSTNYQLI